MSGHLPGAPGRRVAGRADRRRWSPTLVVGLVAVLLTGLALVTQAPSAEQPGAIPSPPRAEALRSRALACPPALSSESPSVIVASGAAESGGGADEGAVSIRAADDDAEEDVDLAAGQTRTEPGPEALVVTGTDALAPGLLAARLGGPGLLAAGECPAPDAEEWFLGAGAGARHASRLQLVNPDAGPAVADVTLWSTEGEMERVESRGLTVPGGSSTVIDLADVAPHRNELAMRVAVVRGRLSATVEDEYATAEEQEPVRDWLPATREPATSLVVPGLPREAEGHTLTLVNPGGTEGRVGVQVVGRETTFTPSGLEEIRVPAGRVVVTDLGDALGGQLAGEDVSLRLTGTVPVAAGLRSVVSGDLVHLPAVPVADGPGAAVVPGRGSNVLVLAGAEVAGRVDVTFLGAGTAGEIGTERLRLRPDVTATVTVPPDARTVLVDSSTGYAAAVRGVGDEGVAVLPVRPLVLDQLVPQVTPARP